MHDSRLSVDVDVYKIGNPDMYGAIALAYYKGDGNMDAYAKDSVLSNITGPAWYTTAMRYLTPS